MKDSKSAKRIIRYFALCLMTVLFLTACSAELPSDVFYPDDGPTEKQTEPLTEVPSEAESVADKDKTALSDLPVGSTFAIHFLDVGQGDSALVICDDEAMLIDGGSSQNSDLLYTYLKEQNIDHLKYIVATHPDSDHVGGLAGALNYATAENAWSSVVEYDGNEAFNDFKRYLGETELTVPEVGREFSLGSAKGKVIGPVRSSEGGPDSNDSSLVIKISYGETSFLFTGDAEKTEESDIVGSGEDISADVIKIGHHGSDSSSTQFFLNAVHPKYAVISCGQRNTYGHPTDQVLGRLQNMNVILYRTDIQGHIICKSDGTNITFEPQRNADANTYMTYAELYPVEESTEGVTLDRTSGEGASGVRDYVLNTSRQKIHEADCRDVKKMAEKNKAYVTGTYEEVLAAYPGYTPCGNCHPEWGN